MGEYDCVKRWEYDSGQREMGDRLDRLYMQFEENVPYFLVGITGAHERRYVAAFSTEDKLKAFVRDCRCKTSPYDFRKRSPLGGFTDYDIVRFYVPSLPIDPQPSEDPKQT